MKTQAGLLLPPAALSLVGWGVPALGEAAQDRLAGDFSPTHLVPGHLRAFCGLYNRATFYPGL